MPLPEESDIVIQGDGCSTRPRYRVTKADLDAITERLDKIDGDNPFVVYKLESIQRTLGGGTKASASCVAWYLNKIISEQDELSSSGVYVHTSRGNIRFDRNSPTTVETEPPG